MCPRRLCDGWPKLRSRSPHFETLCNNRGIHSKPAAGADAPALPPDAVWIDLISPEASETAFVERTTGLAVPSLDELSEIESSSRLRARDGALYVSAPLIFRPEPDQPLSTPVGFVLTRDRLITVRFAELPSFASFADRTIPADSLPVTSAGIFTELLEVVVDRLADALERSASELDGRVRDTRHAAADIRAVIDRCVAFQVVDVVVNIIGVFGQVRNDHAVASESDQADAVLRQLGAHRWNISRTAATIGLHRQSLQEKLRELGIRRPGLAPPEEEE